eukprot:11542616-Alexandrium_andersonii.AAC.1
MLLLALMWLGMVYGYLNLVVKIVQLTAECCCRKPRAEATTSRGHATRYRSVGVQGPVTYKPENY